ncbi:MAG: Ig-like domain-containing protein [Acidobacteria bacterium]|nr:Ig-like domain-containing protein [Acidobacteriota bacterium]
MLQRTRALSFAALLAFCSMGQTIRAQGTVSAWGSNSAGVLGNGTKDPFPVPAQISGFSGVTAVAQGLYHAIALKSDGTVWTWGDTQYGQLGIPSVTRSNVPLQVPGLTGVIAIAAAREHSLALKSDGTVWGWGRNDLGQLGGISDFPFTPEQIPSLTGVIAVAAGSYHNLALKSDGTVSVWGNNSSGQLGLGNTTYRFTPVSVPSLTGVIAIAAGEEFSIALKSDGTVRTWGKNNSGQLGNGSTVNSSSPVTVTGLTGVVTAVAAGFEGAFALLGDGTVWSWGDNFKGRLGNGANPSTSIPLPVTGFTAATAIMPSSSHTLAVKSDGTVWAWGDNAAGALGNFPGALSPTPVQVNGVSGATGFGPAKANCGGSSLVLTSQGLAASVTVDSGSPQSAPVNTPFPQPLSIKVRDANNLPVQGALLRLNAPPTGASVVFPNALNPFRTTLFTNALGIATVSATANATAGGPYSVTATVLGLPDAILSLTNTPALPVSITVTPANPSIAKGLTQQFTATGAYADSSTQNITSQVTWASATPANATITAGGLATGAAIGTSTITATFGAVTGSTLLTVAAPVLQSIAITPVNPSVTKGLTRQFTATGTYSDASTQNISGAVTWSSGTPATATINSTGLATAVEVGTSAISATQGAISGATVLTVTAPIAATVTLSNLSQTYTGSPLMPTATTTPPGLPITWTGAPQTAAGSYSVTATISDPNYSGSANGVFTIAKAAPVLTWNAPAAIQFGSALGSGQLNATSNVPGAFVYIPPAGTVLPVGTHALSVAFTPADAANYLTGSANTSITVNASSGGGGNGTPANLVVTRTLRRTGDTISVDLVLANTGGAAALNVVLTAVRIGTTNAAGLPLNVGTIEPGQSQTLTLQVPGTAGSPGAASSLTVSGTYTGGSFNSTLRITLP